MRVPPPAYLLRSLHIHATPPFPTHTFVFPNIRARAHAHAHTQIRSTPCFITLRKGEPVYTQTGSNKEKLEAGLR